MAQILIKHWSKTDKLLRSSRKRCNVVFTKVDNKREYDVLTLSTGLLFVEFFSTFEIEIYKTAKTFALIMIKNYIPRTTTRNISLFSFSLWVKRVFRKVTVSANIMITNAMFSKFIFTQKILRLFIISIIVYWRKNATANKTNCIQEHFEETKTMEWYWCDIQLFYFATKKENVRSIVNKTTKQNN